MVRQVWVIFFLTVFTLACIPASAYAQQNAEQFAMHLQLLNRTPATRNPQFKTWQNIMDARVLDGNRQLVGSLEDLKIDENGSVSELVSEISWVGDKNEIVKHPIGETTFLSGKNFFEVPLSVNADNRVTSPEALAAIAPAAGGGKLYSFKAMKGAQVLNTGGNWVGIVKDLLIDDEMRAVQALVLEDVPGARRYTEIAIPFDTEHISVNTRYDRIEFRLNPAAAKAVTDFARDSR